MNERLSPEVKAELLADYEADHEDNVFRGNISGRGAEQAMGGERVWQSVLKRLGLETEMNALMRFVEITPERSNRINQRLAERYPKT